MNLVEKAVTELKAGRPIIVTDAPHRENEGDFMMAAEFASPEWIAWGIRHSSGFLCAPMTEELANRFELPLMVESNQDTRKTAYTISVDAAEGITTGISAHDRAFTLRTLANRRSGPADIIRPGHILPLRAVAGGVLERPGHTEATVDLLKLAGLNPVGVIGELMNDDGTMMGGSELKELADANGLVIVSIEEMIEYVSRENLSPSTKDSNRFAFEVETLVPTVHGEMRIRAYRDKRTGTEHLAILSGNPVDDSLVRVHSECLTGEALGSLKCECGPQLDAALDLIHEKGGVVVYLRGQEGRGIGLNNKLRAYRLQEDGLDTLDANLALGLPADNREYSAAAAILHDLGLESVRLLSNNPEKAKQLKALGVEVSELVPLIVGVGSGNSDYLSVKRDKMGHRLPLDLDATTGKEG